MTVSSTSTGLRHLLQISDLSPNELSSILDLAATIKRDPAYGEAVLRGRSVALIFEKPSTRTRVSFAAAAARLGVAPIVLRPDELQLSRGEPIADTARSLSGYVDAIVLRTLAHETLEEFARWASVPVVNALSDRHHPCQALADLLTIREEFGSLAGLRLVFLGDGRNNVAHSLLEAGAAAGMELTIGCPTGYEPAPDVFASARATARRTGAHLSIVHDPARATERADVVYANVWASMSEEEERDARARALASYRVTDEVMERAKSRAIFMHCLPARRGEEVTASVIDGYQSVVWRQSANCLPTEQALLMLITDGLERTPSV